MTITQIIILLISLIIGAILGIFISIYKRAKLKHGTVKLRAIKTHSNRTLNFTKNKEYMFYKNGDTLSINYDDNNSCRDIYVFHGQDLLDGFASTDFYSKLVLGQMKEPKKS